ncbi:MAG TPA: hypothetical protein VKB16_08765 [Beijerinckiaceae bacterium]|jgi:hypothetical protein|nr:hypothetical protein [Beijerinckiaceae bacterium]
MRAVIGIGLLLAVLAGPALAQSTTPQGGAPQAGFGEADIRELLEAAKASAKAARESVDYARVTPDILTQILAKLDKIENKLDKIENAVKATAPRRPAR